MSDELKPCPFCGGEAEYERKGDRRQSTIVSCTMCVCTLESGAEWDHWRDWNTRADTDALTAAQEENERLVHDIERLSTSLSAEVTENERLREAAFSLRNAQRAYMEDRGNDEKGRAVGMAAADLDAALDGLPR